MTQSQQNYQNDPSAHATHLTKTEARSGERRGLYRILAISTLLAAAMLGVILVGFSGHDHVSPQTHPNGQPVSTSN
ncbi:MAG TPA: hypothetical protein VHY32_08215 [Caulobacteraceae bacterium]|nr:hypothetical protein [Caulobacteraceae bacterium]